ncbi:MAG: pyridoxamine 5'-phosphate oxidase family protein [Alphaproteobacteria bacterium]|jgi:uncharacterized protein YhbP (UPF0306 family)|nr:pyridoxamine 5'-phosphate oxidase family protein [Alphaproteobacteria bacterium]MDP6830107.1 pyridoxamine 5'-phosphate oxidase family protein [Alphaproteobacteria bacterium]MDP6872468.1 pyridoxamine 5'-phosphate oxidase family protein [Alphaproteobacteria bacterium]
MTLADRILGQLRDHTVCTLATASDAGAHAASLMYALDGYALVWLSEAKSRHSRDLENKPEVTVTIARQYDDFEKIVGLQMTGRASRVAAAADRRATLALLAARYAFLEQFQSGPKALVARFAAIDYYRFEPQTITLIDNSKGFGHKETLEAPFPSAP